MNPEPLLHALAAHPSADETEHAHASRIVEFLRTEAQPFSRATAHGHITGSAVIVDAAREHMLLIWHEKLQRWLQPGGHCEPDGPEWDVDVAATALRELCEETELRPQQVTLQPQVFDVDVHRIPARKQEPDHWHYDVRFLFVVNEPVQFENPLTRWVPMAELLQLADASLSRLAMKVVKSRPR